MSGPAADPQPTGEMPEPAASPAPSPVASAPSSSPVGPRGPADPSSAPPAGSAVPGAAGDGDAAMPRPSSTTAIIEAAAAQAEAHAAAQAASTASAPAVSGAQVLLDKLCDAFESACRAAKRYGHPAPEVEFWLKRLPAAQRHGLGETLRSELESLRRDYFGIGHTAVGGATGIAGPAGDPQADSASASMGLLPAGMTAAGGAGTSSEAGPWGRTGEGTLLPAITPKSGGFEPVGAGPAAVGTGADAAARTHLPGTPAAGGAGHSPGLSPRSGRKTGRWADAPSPGFGAGMGAVESAAGDGGTTVSLRAGTTFGEYDLIAPLGRGGMGVVWRARDRRTERVVALKVLRTERLVDLPVDRRSELVERFRREAVALARIDHPHIVTVFEVGQVGELPYYSMRLIEGATLGDRLAVGPLPPVQAAEVVAAVSDAVAAAHRAGILHRDIKPRNILLEGGTPDHPGKPVMADFGLAKLQFAVDLTHSADLLGTPRYMAPEQTVDPSAVTPAADIYSLGAVLYEALTGRPPFDGQTWGVLARQILNEAPIPPARRGVVVPTDLEALCLRCLAKDAADRPASADVLSRKLFAIMRRLEEDAARDSDGAALPHLSRGLSGSGSGKVPALRNPVAAVTMVEGDDSPTLVRPSGRVAGQAAARIPAAGGTESVATGGLPSSLTGPGSSLGTLVDKPRDAAPMAGPADGTPGSRSHESPPDPFGSDSLAGSIDGTPLVDTKPPADMAVGEHTLQRAAQVIAAAGRPSAPPRTGTAAPSAPPETSHEDALSTAGSPPPDAGSVTRSRHDDRGPSIDVKPRSGRQSVQQPNVREMEAGQPSSEHSGAGLPGPVIALLLVAGTMLLVVAGWLLRGC